MSEQDEKDVIIEWKHDETFGDWTLAIPLPRGDIRGSVSFTHPTGCPGTQPNTVWGTIEVRVPGRHSIKTDTYDNPPEGVDAVSRGIMAVMAGIITKLESAD